MSDTQQQAASSDATQAQHSSSVHLPNGHSETRSERQKALDRLARACWYLLKDEGSASPIEKRNEMHSAFTAFGYGLFGHEGFTRSVRAQPDTTTSSSTGTRDPAAVRPTDVVQSVENVNGIRTDISGAVSAKAQVEHWLDSAAHAMVRVDGLEHAAPALDEIMSWFELQRPSANRNRAKSASDDSSAAVRAH